MLKLSRHPTIAAAAIIFITSSLPNHAGACMVFSEADPAYWAEHSTSIVDATVYDFEQRPLVQGIRGETRSEYPNSWVLKLNVHKTLRGEMFEKREVATRFLNSTTVDEAFVSNLLGQRREIAIVGVPYAERSSTFPGSDEPDFLMQDGVHVFDANGDEIDEIWELLCVELPIFEAGTFEN